MKMWGCFAAAGAAAAPVAVFAAAALAAMAAAAARRAMRDAMRASLLDICKARGGGGLKIEIK
jgi:hypothetical protein